MIRSLENPTTASLHVMYPISSETEQAVAQSRTDFSISLDSQGTHTLGVVGYRAQPGLDNLEAVLYEGASIREVSSSEGLYTANRVPFWQSQSTPNERLDDETTDAEGVYLSVVHEAELYANVASELGFRRHLSRYGHLLSFGWIGSRNVDNTDLITAAATHDPSLPLGIKNGPDGSIDQALDQVALVNKLRGEGAAPAVLIYRGGENAKKPADWERKYIEALAATDGRLIVDTANNSEMAFDPEGKYGKSEIGQIRVLETVIGLARDNGLMPAGILMEAGDLPCHSDPHMPLDVALNGLLVLHKLKSDAGAV